MIQKWNGGIDAWINNCLSVIGILKFILTILWKCCLMAWIPGQEQLVPSWQKDSCVPVKSELSFVMFGNYSRAWSKGVKFFLRKSNEIPSWPCWLCCFVSCADWGAGSSELFILGRRGVMTTEKQLQNGTGGTKQHKGTRSGKYFSKFSKEKLQP